MPSDLLARLRKLISQVATRTLLSVDDITTEFEADLKAAANQAPFSKVLVASAGLYRAKAQFGKLRVSLLAGTELLGPPFLRLAERTGLLLSDNMPPAKYGRFLSALEREVSTSRDELFRAMHERVTTYVAYSQFATAAEESFPRAAPLLRRAPRTVVKRVLALTCLAFLAHYMDFEIEREASDWLAKFHSPEDVASVASLLLAKANEVPSRDRIESSALPLVPFASAFPHREDRSKLILDVAVDSTQGAFPCPL